MRHYACAIPLRETRILLGLRAPHRKAYPQRWDVIGGRVEAGETILQALHRELREEIGIAPVRIEALGGVVDNGPMERGGATYHMHVVRSWTGDGPLLANDEHTELRWFTIAEACALPDLALADYRDLFRRIKAA